MKKNNKNTFSFGEKEYINTMKAILRKEEMERQGGRWIAKDRPHKSEKDYNRKKEKIKMKNFFKEVA